MSTRCAWSFKNAMIPCNLWWIGPGFAILLFQGGILFLPCQELICSRKIWFDHPVQMEPTYSTTLFRWSLPIPPPGWDGCLRIFLPCRDAIIYLGFFSQVFNVKGQKSIVDSCDKFKSTRNQRSREDSGWGDLSNPAVGQRTEGEDGCWSCDLSTRSPPQQWVGPHGGWVLALAH